MKIGRAVLQFLGLDLVPTSPNTTYTDNSNDNGTPLMVSPPWVLFPTSENFTSNRLQRLFEIRTIKIISYRS